MSSEQAPKPLPAQQITFTALDQTYTTEKITYKTIRAYGNLQNILAGGNYQAYKTRTDDIGFFTQMTIDATAFFTVFAPEFHKSINLKDGFDAIDPLMQKEVLRLYMNEMVKPYNDYFNYLTDWS